VDALDKIAVCIRQVNPFVRKISVEELEWVDKTLGVDWMIDANDLSDDVEAWLHKKDKVLHRSMSTDLEEQR
jgi:hypothetical protein